MNAASVLATSSIPAPMLPSSSEYSSILPLSEAYPRTCCCGVKEDGANRIVLDMRDFIAGRAATGAVEYVRDAARGREEAMVVSSTAAGCVETTGTTGVLNRMAMDRLEKSIVVVCSANEWYVM